MNREEARRAGWVKYADRGSSYNHREQPNIWLLKSGNMWKVWDSDKSATLATGRTMTETIDNWKENSQ